MSADLEGILVVALEQAVAAPLASRHLADAGARVIKVERPEGDFARGYDAYCKGESANFVWLNAGKESLRLDLKQADDLAVMNRLLARADIFLQNLAPGACERLGLGAGELRRRHQRLITCSISGYGDSGPLRQQKAYDLLVQAESGLASINGIDKESTRVGVSVCDIAAGMTAASALFRALFARERTGEGRAIEVSLFHAIGEWMNVPYLTYAYGQHEPPRLGLHHPTIAPYGAYQCGDGRSLLVAVQNEREWQRLCVSVLERPDLADDARFAGNPARVRHRAELDAVLEPAFRRFDREALTRRLETAQIAYGRLSSLDDLVSHPQNRTRSVLTSAGERVDLLAPGAVVVGETAELCRVPALGEHDAALREEFSR